MSTATALSVVSQAGASAPVAQYQQLTPEKVDLLKRTVAKDTTDDELELFVHVANRFGLDPFAKQIHCVKRFDGESGSKKMTIQTGIDGFRLIAERTGKTDGQDGPYWCGSDGKWMDVWLREEPPAAAKVLVYRKGESHACVGVAKLSEYAQRTRGGDLNSMWRRMPTTMLAKCAEALALRKAFPAELSGIYTNEEMSQADAEPAATSPRSSRAASPAAEPRKDPTPEEVFARNKAAIMAAKTVNDMPPSIKGGKWMSDAQIAELKTLKTQRTAELQDLADREESVADAEIAEKPVKQATSAQPTDPKVLEAKADALYQRLAQQNKDMADELWTQGGDLQEIIDRLHAALMKHDAAYQSKHAKTVDEAKLKTHHPDYDWGNQ